MAYADQEMSGNRVVAIIIVALLHIGLAYALVTGLAYEAATKVIERVTTVDVTEEPPPEEPEEPPPPPEEIPEVPPVVAPPPELPLTNTVSQSQTVDDAPIDRPVDSLPTQTCPDGSVIAATGRCPEATKACPTGVRVPVSQACPAPSQARGATPRNQNRWARQIQERYPSRALRQEIEGTVGVSVTVGANGRVSACSVSRSSGSDVLDKAACDGMRRYARFNEALDDAGNPTSGSYNTSIQYRLN